MHAHTHARACAFKVNKQIHTLKNSLTTDFGEIVLYYHYLRIPNPSNTRTTHIVMTVIVHRLDPQFNHELHYQPAAYNGISSQ